MNGDGIRIEYGDGDGIRIEWVDGDGIRIGWVDGDGNGKRDQDAFPWARQSLGRSQDSPAAPLAAQ